MFKVVVMHVPSLLHFQEPPFRHRMMDPEVRHIVNQVAQREPNQPRVSVLHAQHPRRGVPKRRRQDHRGHRRKHQPVKVHGRDMVMPVDQKVDDIPGVRRRALVEHEPVQRVLEQQPAQPTHGPHGGGLHGREVPPSADQADVTEPLEGDDGDPEEQRHIPRAFREPLHEVIREHLDGVVRGRERVDPVVVALAEQADLVEDGAVPADELPPRGVEVRVGRGRQAADAVLVEQLVREGGVVVRGVHGGADVGAELVVQDRRAARVLRQERGDVVHLLVVDDPRVGRLVVVRHGLARERVRELELRTTERHFEGGGEEGGEEARGVAGFGKG